MKPNSSVRETHCDYTLTVNIRYTEHKKDKCGYPESDIFKNNKVLFENKISFEYAVDIITKQAHLRKFAIESIRCIEFGRKKLKIRVVKIIFVYVMKMGSISAFNYFNYRL